MVMLVYNIASAMSIASLAAGTLQAIMTKGVQALYFAGIVLVGLFAGLAVLKTLKDAQKQMVDDLKKNLFSDSPSGMPSGSEKGTFSNTGNDADLGGSQQNTELLQEHRRLLQEIARNTNNLNDLKRFVVGGGTQAQLGITQTELGRARGNSVQVSVLAGSRNLNAALSEIVQETVLQMMRQGLISAV